MPITQQRFSEAIQAGLSGHQLWSQAQQIIEDLIQRLDSEQPQYSDKAQVLIDGLFALRALRVNPADQALLESEATYVRLTRAKNAWSRDYMTRERARARGHQPPAGLTTPDKPIIRRRPKPTGTRTEVVDQPYEMGPNTIQQSGETIIQQSGDITRIMIQDSTIMQPEDAEGFFSQPSAPTGTGASPELPFEPDPFALSPERKAEIDKMVEDFEPNEFLDPSHFQGGREKDRKPKG